MSNVALCVAGQARAVAENFECIKRCILDPLQPDVFVHTWHAPEDEGGAYPQNPDALLDLYRPQISAVDPLQSFERHDFDAITEPTGDLLDWHFQRINSMYYSIWAANALKQSAESLYGFKYDWVIRCRTDVILDGVLDLGRRDPSAMYLHIQDLELGPRCNDIFSFSNSKNMDAYAQTFLNMGRIMREIGVMSSTQILTHQIKIIAGIEDVRESPLTHEGFYREGNINEQVNKDLIAGKVPKIK